jgi:hypothetical protein
VTNNVARFARTLPTPENKEILALVHVPLVNIIILFNILIPDEDT